MSERWQIRRGTTQENDDFTGAQGELTMDTQKKQLRVHDGTTRGGAGIIDPIVAFQVPTAANGYTWYRKYRSGWVEQGGLTRNDVTVYDLPVTMADTNYYVNGTWNGGKSSVFYPADWRCYPVSTTQIFCNAKNNTNVNSYAWEVKGMAA